VGPVRHPRPRGGLGLSPSPGGARAALAWPARQGPAPYYKSNAPRPLEPKTQSRSRCFRQTLASAPSPLLELGAPSCIADSTASRRLQALQEIRTEVVRLTGLFFPLFRPASPGNARRCRTSAMRRRELRSARDSSRRCLRRVSRAARMLPVPAAFEIQVGRPFSAHAGDAPPPQSRRRRYAPPPAPPFSPIPRRPSDLNRTAQIRSDPSQLVIKWSTMVFLHINPSILVY